MRHKASRFVRISNSSSCTSMCWAVCMDAIGSDEHGRADINTRRVSWSRLSSVPLVPLPIRVRFQV